MQDSFLNTDNSAEFSEMREAYKAELPNGTATLATDVYRQALEDTHRNARGLTVMIVHDDAERGGTARVDKDLPGVYFHRRMSKIARFSIDEVDITFIDGDHSLHGVTSDLVHFVGITRHIIAGHDFVTTRFSGVVTAVLEMMRNGTDKHAAYGYRVERPVYLDSDFTWWARMKPGLAVEAMPLEGVAHLRRRSGR
jgi:hypothetical protein